uniref:Uncharacterized protein n=1 Tax=Arion vulgaris TaxID=1028688 RepID=A0A0B7AXP5_9EUPU
MITARREVCMVNLNHIINHKENYPFRTHHMQLTSTSLQGEIRAILTPNPTHTRKNYSHIDSEPNAYPLQRQIRALFDSKLNTYY